MTRRYDPRVKKAENLLAWWADSVARGEEVNGYPSESPLINFLSGVFGYFCSKPLYKGAINDNTCKIIDLLLQAGMTSKEYFEVFVCFYPGLKQHEREEKSGCCERTLRNRKAKAVDILLDNWSAIYPRH